MPIPLLSKLSMTANSSDAGTEPQGSDSSSSISSSTLPRTPQHFYDKKMSFKLKETILPLKGSYCVTLADDDGPAYKICGKMLSMGRKTIRDVTENELYTLVEAKVSLRDRMTILDKSGNEILTLRKKGLVPGMGAFTIQAFEGDDKENPEPVFEIRSNPLKSNFLITDLLNGECVAAVRRKVLSAGALLVGKDCYYVDVEPSTDCPLMMMFVVALDEVFRDGSGFITGGGVRGLL